MKSIVSLVKSANHFDATYACLENIKDNILNSLRDGKNIIIKINFVSTIRELATTPSKSVEALLEFLRKSGYKGEITIAETATMGNTRFGFKVYGFEKMAKKYNASILDLSKDQSVPIEIIDTNGDPINVLYSKTIKDADYVVSITRPKTHDTVVATLCIKNLAVGGIIKKRYLVHQNNNIHPNLVRLIKFRMPNLCILDGTVGMHGNGPIMGTPIKCGWAAASLDPVAIDSLALYLMGFDINNVGYLNLCGNEKLGNLFPENVKIIGEDPKDLIMDFKPHQTYETQIIWKDTKHY